MTALEARVQDSSAGTGEPVDTTVKFSAVWLSVITGSIYTWGALMVSFDLKWNDVNLPRVSWLPVGGSPGPVLSGTSNSAFVIAAKESGIRGLPTFMTVGLVVSAITAANTTLYVASRTLFSLCRGMEVSPVSPWIHRCLAFLGKTNERQVPMRAILASCFFSWIPFLYLSSSKKSGTAIGTVSL